jgi:hypothetical protein
MVWAATLSFSTRARSASAMLVGSPAPESLVGNRQVPAL